MVPSGFAEVDELLRDPLVTIDKADLHGGCRRAIISYNRNGSARKQLQVEVVDRAISVAFLQHCQIELTSHFNLTKT